MSDESEMGWVKVVECPVMAYMPMGAESGYELGEGKVGRKNRGRSETSN